MQLGERPRMGTFDVVRFPQLSAVSRLGEPLEAPPFRLSLPPLQWWLLIIVLFACESTREKEENGARDSFFELDEIAFATSIATAKCSIGQHHACSIEEEEEIELCD